MSLVQCPFNVGAIVRYCGVQASKNHDYWIGNIVEIHDIQTLYGDRRELWVRWIKPCGDPTDGTTRHAELELTHASDRGI